MLSDRGYQDITDLQSMIDLLRAVRALERVTDWPGVVELQEVMQRPAVTAKTRLWFDNGGLIAWAFVDEWTNLHFLGRPPTEAWAEAVFRWAWDLASKCDGVEAPSLNANAAESDAGRIALLLDHGFTEQAERTLYYVRSLEEPLDEPVHPPGFVIRPVREDEVEEAAALHRAAFGTEYMTVENRRAMMRSEAYDPEGDLVAVTSDGRLAAYTMASISPTENAVSGRRDGFTDPVATHPSYRRLALAKALLLTGCGHLKAKGATRARLGTSSENTGMRAAAESAGYRVESAMLWFTKRSSLG